MPELSPLSVKLKPVVSYEVITEDGRSLGIFLRTDRWRTLAALDHATHGTLVVQEPQGFSSLFRGIFERDDTRPVDVTVMMVSPKLSAFIQPPAAPAPAGAAASEPAKEGA